VLAVLQVKLDNTGTCLDALFLFSLIWSIGATCDRPSETKFNTFLRQLVAGRVTAAADRSDFDLGPGLTISYPEQLLSTQMPEVSSEISCFQQLMRTSTSAFFVERAQGTLQAHVSGQLVLSSRGRFRLFNKASTMLIHCPAA
jgi:hypothetical protein